MNNERSILVLLKKAPNENDSGPQLMLLPAPTSPYSGPPGPLFLDLLLLIAVGDATLFASSSLSLAINILP